jgi:dipeptidyl aminopeptidase/acylaminoacyl peptidase
MPPSAFSLVGGVAMRIIVVALLLFVVPVSQLSAQVAVRPAALEADGVPDVPQDLVARTRPYLEFRTATFFAWHPTDRSMLIATRFGNTSQVHRVARPDGARVQLTFEEEPVAYASHAPRRGDVTVVLKDVGGDEFYQLYRLDSGRLERLTDGKSRNEFGAWSKDGSLVGYSSTRRNGTDTDLYIVDPRDAKSDRRVAECKGGGWNFADFSPDGKRAAVLQYISITHSRLWLIDVASGALTPVGDHSKPVAYGGAQFAPDGTLWVTTDAGSEFLRLGTIDAANGRFTPRTPDTKWDVESFDISDDGTFVAYVLNDAGRGTLRLLDIASGNARTAPLPAGTIASLDVAPWGEVGLTLSSARSPADAYSVDPATLAITRWTVSETGGLDASTNVEPELIEVRSFDGLAISGFLYRPDPAKFAGRRPLIVSIHGGPESQSRPGFLGRNNYLLNELGIAIFYPNVRGSSGYGKAFVSLDNGPDKREDSVRDIAAFLDLLAADPRLDPARFGVTGGSYGGYMCYASAIFYGDRLKGATCIVAISSFVTFLENTQGYRRDLRRVEYGDERDPAQREKLTAISPLTRAKDIRIPVFVVTGANDPRVPASEADQVIAAIRSNGGMAWHLLGRDEGHGFAKKANQDYQFWASLLFWQQTLLRE